MYLNNRSAAVHATSPCSVGTILPLLFSLVLLACIWGTSTAESSFNGLEVTVPNGYARVEVEDISLETTAGPVRWRRVWDGQEWKFNPQWESLSQSWKNLTGSQTADTSGGTLASGGGANSNTLLSTSSGGSGGGSSDGCWVLVDEDWTPSTGSVVIGGIPKAEPMQPIRTTPFNRLMGEAAADYPPPMRVSVDYASLCGGAISTGGLRDAEAIRRQNELYLGDAGRYAFSNRAVLEKRAVKALPTVAAADFLADAADGQTGASPVEVPKGYRWLDKQGSWIDYNVQGQVVAYGDRNDNTVWLVRDAAGVLRGVVDATGRVLLSLHYTGQLLTEVRDYPITGLAGELPTRRVHYRYDADNRLVEVTDVRGNATLYEYDVAHHITRITDPEGHVDRLAYSGDSVKQWIAADGGITDYHFEFDDTNKQFVSQITGPVTKAGRRVEDLTHNRTGQLVRRLVNGRTDQEISYDSGSRSETETNARGFRTRLTRNEFDQITEIVHPDGARESRRYEARFLNRIERADENGFTTRYDYDGRGNLIRKTEASGTADQRITEYGRNELGQVVSVTRKGRVEADGTSSVDSVWRFEFDPRGQLSVSTDPEGNVRRYVYDRAGNLIAYTDPLDRTAHYTVDAAGNLIEMKDALNRVWHYAYDKLGNETRYTDARGKAELRAYDAMSRLLRVTNPTGGSYRLGYNGQGSPTGETDEDGHKTVVDYDNDLRLIQQLDGMGNATRHGYQIEDGTNQGTLGSLLLPTRNEYPTYAEQLRFDERERATLKTVLNPTADGIEGLVSSTKYDKRGQVVESTNADGKTSYFTYDAYGRVRRFTNSLGKSIDLTWNTRGSLIRIRDYNGNESRLEYDRVNRLTRLILPSGKTTQYEYDGKGNRIGVIDAAGNQVRYTYDAGDRLTKTAVTKAGEPSAGLVYTFTHDAEDNLTGWSDGTRSATYSFDDNGRRLSETVDYGDGVQLGYVYEYTPAGFTKSLQYPDGTKIGYGYAAHGELSEIEIPGEGTLSVNAWDWVAPKKITLPGGTVRELTHDGLLKLTDLKVKNPGQQTLLDLSTRYGKREQLTERSLTDADGNTRTTRFDYDAEMHLTKAEGDLNGQPGPATETLQVDAAGNRISHSAVSGLWRYDQDNRLIQRGDAVYAYDDNGNLIRRTVGTSGTPESIRLFEYDALDRLAEVRDGAGALIARYTYDAFDHRLIAERYRDAAGHPLTTAERVHFLYGDEGMLAEADAAGTVTTQYGWRPGGEWSTDPVFIKTAITRDGNTQTAYAYYHNDQLGTPIRATDRDGNIVWRAEYSIDGAAILGAGNALRSNLRLAGQYFDAETGLHYNTRRYYDPEIGRFLTADPTGYGGGWNLYEYAGGDPINQLDPTGEWIWVAIRVAMTVYDIYTEYKAIQEEGACYDWTRLIPIPIKVPKVKWLTKRFKQCSNPCECLAAAGAAAGAMNSFPADTPVHALDANGKPALIPIGRLKPGDKVLAKEEWKPEAESLSYEPINDVLTTPGKQRTLVHLRLADGRTLTATDGHPFKTTEGWRDAILLKKGGKLLLRGDGEPADTSVSRNEHTIVITDVSVTTKTLTTYNLEVANAHTFFVGEQGALVHNGFGAYFLRFSDGCWYAGKGDKDRMKDSIRERSRPNRKLKSALHWPASSNEESYRLEDMLIEQAGEICDPCSLNERNSPGKKMRR